MYLKKKGTILISTVIILSLTVIIGSLMFKMMRNNNALSCLYDSSMDIYDLDSNEEKNLYEFMMQINKKIKENPDNTNIFSDDFEMKYNSSTLEYKSKNNELRLETNMANNINREREIMCLYKQEKILLIPTYKFQDNY